MRLKILLLKLLLNPIKIPHQNRYRLNKIYLKL